MRFTARARLDIWANLSYVQSDEATYGLQMESTSLVASNRLGSSGDGSRCVDVDALEHATGNRWMEMNDDAENMRLECERAWREVDAIAKERDALRAEVDALRADAERYRWLRGGPDVPTESIRWARWEVRHWCGRWWNTMFSAQLDAAIDAAMKGTT